MTNPTPSDAVVGEVAGADGAAPQAPAVVPATPFGRIMGTMIASYVGGIIALGAPLSILLTLKLTELVDESAVPAALGAIAGAGAITGLIVNPMSGRISDRTRLRFGRRRTWILAGGLGGACAIASITLATEVWQIVVLWCLVEILIGVQMSVTGALMADQVPAARRGSISGTLGLIVAVGPLLGLAVITPLEGALQWYVVAGFGAAGAIIAVLLLKDPLPSTTPEPLRMRVILLSFWVDPRRHPAFAWAWLVRFFVGACGAAGVYNSVFLLQKIGISREDLAANVLGLSTIVVVIGGAMCLLAGVLSDRLRLQKPFVLVSAMLSASSLVILAFADSMPMVYLSTAVGAIGAGIFLSVDIALSSRMLPNPEDVGKDWGVMSLAGTIPSSVVPFVAPLLLQVGGFTTLYLTLSVFGVIGGLLVLRLPELGREGDPRWALLTKEPR